MKAGGKKKLVRNKGIFYFAPLYIRKYDPIIACLFQHSMQSICGLCLTLRHHLTAYHPGESHAQRNMVKEGTSALVCYLEHDNVVGAHMQNQSCPINSLPVKDITCELSPTERTIPFKEPYPDYRDKHRSPYELKICIVIVY